jgi:hypothetical protein
MPLDNLGNAPSAPQMLDLDTLDQEERITLAIKAIKDQGFRPNGNPYLSFRRAAQDFQVPSSTLNDRFHGIQDRKESHSSQRRLSIAHEEILVAWIVEMGRRGVPLQARAVAERASAIAGVEVSESWVRRFRTRHPEIRARWTTGLEKCRAMALNPKAVESFYETLKELIEEHNIPPENIYNMDEKGIQLGVGKKVLAFFDRDQKDVHSVEDGNRELVTFMETISADGKALRPTVVFKGHRRDLEWGRINPCDAR